LTAASLISCWYLTPPSLQWRGEPGYLQYPIWVRSIESYRALVGFNSCQFSPPKSSVTEYVLAKIHLSPDLPRPSWFSPTRLEEQHWHSYLNAWKVLAVAMRSHISAPFWKRAPGRGPFTCEMQNANINANARMQKRGTGSKLLPFPIG
jgi:hypothetical protein